MTATTYLRLATVVLIVSLLHPYEGNAKSLAYTSSENLVWKPYLQQLTDTGVIIL